MTRLISLFCVTLALTGMLATIPAQANDAPQASDAETAATPEPARLTPERLRDEIEALNAHYREEDWDTPPELTYEDILWNEETETIILVSPSLNLTNESDDIRLLAEEIRISGETTYDNEGRISGIEHVFLTQPSFHMDTPDSIGGWRINEINISDFNPKNAIDGIYDYNLFGWIDYARASLIEINDFYFDLHLKTDDEETLDHVGKFTFESMMFENSLGDKIGFFYFNNHHIYKNDLDLGQAIERFEAADITHSGLHQLLLANPVEMMKNRPSYISMSCGDVEYSNEKTDVYAIGTCGNIELRLSEDNETYNLNVDDFRYKGEEQEKITEIRIPQFTAEFTAVPLSEWGEHFRDDFTPLHDIEARDFYLFYDGVEYSFDHLSLPEIRIERLWPVQGNLWVENFYISSLKHLEPLAEERMEGITETVPYEALSGDILISSDYNPESEEANITVFVGDNAQQNFMDMGLTLSLPATTLKNGEQRPDTENAALLGGHTIVASTQKDPLPPMQDTAPTEQEPDWEALAEEARQDALDALGEEPNEFTLMFLDTMIEVGITEQKMEWRREQRDHTHPDIRYYWQDNPVAVQMIEAFYAEGGQISYIMAPGQPIGRQEFMEFFLSGEPVDFREFFGISLDYTSPIAPDP